jgi:RNA polymerase sigma-70 factor (ECF subfamily)
LTPAASADDFDGVSPLVCFPIGMTRFGESAGQESVMVERAGLGRRDATTAPTLEELVAENYERLLRVAVLICADPADAEDAVQVALERAWRHGQALRDPDRLPAWLHRIVVREAIRLEHRRRGLLGRWLAPPREILVGPSPEADRDLDLQAALRDLPVEQRVALVLHYYAGYSVAETAELSGVSLETARSRLRLARDRLRAALGGPHGHP